MCASNNPFSRRFIALTLLVNAGLFASKEAKAQAGSTAQPPPAGIAGVVIDSVNSQPIVNALVVAQGQDAKAPAVFGSKTGADGRFAIANLPSGSYRLWAEKAGFIRSSASQPGRNDEVTIGDQRGAPRSDLILQLAPQAVIAGKITDPNGEPLSGAAVQVRRERFSGGRITVALAAQQATNDLGEYRIAGLAAGAYYVSSYYRDNGSTLGLRVFTERHNQVEAPGIEDYAVTYYPNTKIAEGATAVRVKAGATASGVDIRMQTGQSVTVSGIVTGAIPAGGVARLMLQPAEMDGLGPRQVATAREGHMDFTFRSVPPGEYVIRTDASAGQQRLSGRFRLSVTDSPVNNIALPLRPWFNMPGVVSMDGNVGAPDGVQFALEGHETKNVNTVQLTANKTFDVAYMAPDAYRISTTGSSESIFLKAVYLNGKSVDPGSLDILDTPGTPLQVILSDSGAVIQGIAGNDKGPEAGALAVMTGGGETGKRTYTTVCDGQGKFTMKAVPPGKYRILCFADLHSEVDLTRETLNKVEAQGDEIVVSARERKTVVGRLVQAEGN